MNNKRIIIVVNKYWECDPVCNVLYNMYINDNSQFKIDLKVKSNMKLLTYPSYGPVIIDDARETKPRIVLEADDRTIEVWCISDLLCNSGKLLQSSSEEKMNLLPYIYNYDLDKEVELVVAVGTASSGPSLDINDTIGTNNINGSVVVGTNVFMHNGYDNKSNSNYDCNCWSEILKAGTTELIESIFEQYNEKVTDLFLCSRRNASNIGPKIYWSKDFIALGDVNVTDYRKYAVKDKKTGEDFFNKYKDNVDGLSVETTHCLIYKAAKDYLKTNPPFVFVSGIVDRYLKFEDDVKPNDYAQNTIGAHNAGITVAWILSKVIN